MNVGLYFVCIVTLLITTYPIANGFILRRIMIRLITGRSLWRKTRFLKKFRNNKQCSKNMLMWVPQLFLWSLKFPSQLIILQITKMTFRFRRNLRMFLMLSMTTSSIWHMGKQPLQNHKLPSQSSTQLFKKLRFMFRKILRLFPMLVLLFISPCKMSMMRLSEHKGICWWIMASFGENTVHAFAGKVIYQHSFLSWILCPGNTSCGR